MTFVLCKTYQCFHVTQACRSTLLNSFHGALTVSKELSAFCLQDCAFRIGPRYNYFLTSTISYLLSVNKGNIARTWLISLCTQRRKNNFVSWGSAARNDKEVHGIMILGTECKIRRWYANYFRWLTILIFKNSLYLLHAFGSMFGLKVNYDKMESLWISSFKNSNSILFSNKQITWAKGKV